MLRRDAWVWPTLAGGLLLLASAMLRPSGCGTIESPEAALASNLATLRQAIALYGAQHAGRVPGQGGDPAEFIRQLTTATDVGGRTGGPLGPYLKSMCASPITGGMRVVVVDRLPRRASIAASETGSAWRSWLTSSPEPGLPSAGSDWIWCPATGEIRANAAGVGPSGTPYYEM